MRLSSLTYTAFEINAVWDTCPDFELSLSELHEAAQKEELLILLATRFGDHADLSLFDMPGSTERQETEAALRLAAEALAGRERRKVGVDKSGMSLAMALVLEAIQQNFCPAQTAKPLA